MSGLAKATYFWRSAVSGLRHHPFVHFVAVLTLAIALAAAGMARATLRVLEPMAASLEEQALLTVYLAADATEAQARVLADELAAQAVSPAQAVARLEAELGDLAGALKDLPENPLPWSVELELGSQVNLPRVSALAEELRGRPGVAAVDFAEGAVKRLSALRRALRVGGGVGFALVLLAAALVVSTTLQLAIYARRNEIEVQKLVGATELFVQTPFLIEGLLQGLLGALVSLGLLWALFAAGKPMLLELCVFLHRPEELAFVLDMRLALELLSLGAALGLAGSLLALRRYARA